MPRGAYLLAGHEGPYAVERFSCAPGPAGWRYTATRERPGSPVEVGSLDVTLDEQGRAVRVHVRAAGWELRGGVAGGCCLWRRGEDERSEPAVGFTGTSPVWLLAAAWLLRPVEPVGARLVELGDESLATSTVERTWQHLGTALHDGTEVSSYEVRDLATAERRVVHMTGDVVLAAPGVVLHELTGTPNT